MASDSAAAVAVEDFSVNPDIWEACAGRSGTIPAVGTSVYYFPQGHAEQALGEVDWESEAEDLSFFFCRVTGVQHLASRSSNEVFAKIRLERDFMYPKPFSSAGGVSSEGVEREEEKLVFVAKVLTPSDANNGGAFSVPRLCADRVFPSLDYTKDNPSQALFVRDLEGNELRFQHIYRGTPRRHLLTTYWAAFVNNKKLIAGDTVIFIKDRTGQIYVGLRRTERSGASAGFPRGLPRAGPSVMLATTGECSTSGQLFSRNRRGRVTPQSVLEAVRAASMGRPFEVTYYPTGGFPEFVLRRNQVDQALNKLWFPGIMVKSQMGTEDSTRMPCFQGAVTDIITHPRPFVRSPWRTLEVTWDEQDGQRNSKMVNPWEMEKIHGPRDLTRPPITKFRATMNSELNKSPVVAPARNPSASQQDVFPDDGIQGVRHDLISSGTSDYRPNGDHLSAAPPEGESSLGSSPTGNQTVTIRLMGNDICVDVPTPVAEGGRESSSEKEEKCAHENKLIHFFPPNPKQETEEKGQKNLSGESFA
ncbi:unnamed protein product [Spirodela intermedia]|uniref:Auxin response factor n=1 Tax=Spirodela intermedia TaxID=51605 RepID=A0A7I8L603_SPIIN|nr:unnamed protein product [Spirodela intermedia]